jgi:hypothetical protein
VACRHVAAMRVAALYDIHASAPALEAVLAEVERAGVDRIVIGGDVVPGPLPAETIERLRALGDRAVFRARQRRSLGGGGVRRAGLDERRRRAPGEAVGGVDRRGDRPARPRPAGVVRRARGARRRRVDSRSGPATHGGIAPQDPFLCSGLSPRSLSPPRRPGGLAPSPTARPRDRSSRRTCKETGRSPRERDRGPGSRCEGLASRTPPAGNG